MNKTVFFFVYPGGVLLALIEGVGIIITRWSAEQFQQGMCHLYHTIL